MVKQKSKHLVSTNSKENHSKGTQSISGNIESRLAYKEMQGTKKQWKDVLNLQQRKFHLDIYKIFTETLVKNGDRMLRGVIGASFLEIFKTCWTQSWRSWYNSELGCSSFERGMVQKKTSSAAFLPKLFYASLTSNFPTFLHESRRTILKLVFPFRILWPIFQTTVMPTLGW